MARLAVRQVDTQPQLRVAGATKTGGSSSRDYISTGAGGLPPKEPANYVNRLAKYIPAEAIALYLTLQQVIAGFNDAPAAAPWVLIAIGLTFTILYLLKLSQMEKGKRDWAQVVVAALAFLVWTLALGTPWSDMDWYHPVWPALLLPGFTALAPLVLK